MVETKPVPQRRSRRERGAAAVEMAIVMPILLLVIAGIVDFGRMYFTQVVITNAAHEGVRAAVSGSLPPASVSARVNAALLGLSPSSATITTNPSSSPCASGTNVVVSVQYPFDWFFMKGALGFFGGSSALPSQLTGKAEMLCS